MKWIYYLVISLLIGLSPYRACGQSNLLSNGGFEGHIPSGDYPRYLESFDDRNAPSWWQYNNDVDVRWYIDSVWTPLHQNQIDPNFQNGHFKSSVFLAAYPWNDGSPPDSMTPQPAHGGQFYAGFDAKTDGPGRQGLQTKASTCGLNSGNYQARLFWARTYQEDQDVKIFLSLSDQMDSRRYIFDDFEVAAGTYTAGQWYEHVSNFSIDLNDQDEVDNDWFSITGQQIGNSNPRHYMYFDDVRLFRPCDVTFRCAKTHGQICPAAGVHQWPNNLMSVSNISNASDLHLKIYNNPSQPVFDQIYHNGNGLPDFHLSRWALPLNLASGNYEYDLEISNACGGFRKTGIVQVFDTALYNASPVWVDTAANWSVTPIPCCLTNLVLQNMQIVGDVSYIVRNEITIQNGVSVAPGSNVIIQAGNVVEMDSVEFDGSNSTVEILEIPCPNRIAGEEGCAENASMVIDGGVAVQQYIKVPEIEDSNSTDEEYSMEFNESGESLNEFSLNIYPNPASDVLTLDFYLPSQGLVKASLMNASGVKVSDVMSPTVLDAGDHSFSVSMKAVPSGMYFLQFQRGNDLKTIKVSVFK
jgi:hypothetical protein